ncbi:MAG: hypothetical protein PHI94_07250 [Eubacteriaceae bacterium]|jgi:hypothetical protein|nr:hypothetical protein [Eubacteriaceae bacterium]
MKLNYKVIYKVGMAPQKISDCDQGFLYEIDGKATIIGEKGQRIPFDDFRRINFHKLADFGNILEVEGVGWSIYLGAVLQISRQGFVVANNWKTKSMKDDLERL